MSDFQLDPNKIVQKLQNQVGEAMGRIAVLQTQVEQLQEMLNAPDGNSDEDKGDPRIDV